MRFIFIVKCICDGKIVIKHVRWFYRSTVLNCEIEAKCASQEDEKECVLITDAANYGPILLRTRRKPGKSVEAFFLRDGERKQNDGVPRGTESYV